MPAPATRPKRSYAPGQTAPVSGLYRVTHLTGHRPPHLAVVIRGEELPACRLCRGAVEYSVHRHASHITHDADFTGPTSLILARR